MHGVNDYSYILPTVKPVYNGQPWGLTKVAFVYSWSLFGNIYIQKLCYWLCCSLCLNCRTHDMTGKNTIVQHMNPYCRFYTKLIYGTLCQLSFHPKVCFYDWKRQRKANLSPVFSRCRQLHNRHSLGQNVDPVVWHNAD